jgi:prepilin-type processing-associated H-X9-DG protein
MYGIDNGGWWPASRHTYTITAFREKRWHDFIGKYVVGGIATAIPFGSNNYEFGEVNPNGTQNQALERQMWSREIKYGNNVMWGCPAWNRVSFSSGTGTGGTLTLDSAFHNGYTMNRYPFAPNDLSAGGFVLAAKDGQGTGPTLPAVTKITGGYFKQSQWKQTSERCLIVESIHGNLILSNNTPVTRFGWQWQPEGANVFPLRPNSSNFSIDFDRHGKRPSGNQPNDPSLNMAFADGHAETVSARQAWRAIRFN